jgi:hypothetical protein
MANFVILAMANFVIPAMANFVIPAKAGIHVHFSKMGPGFRRGDN